MTAYVEVKVAGNRRAFLEAGLISGVITPPGANVFTIASEKEPLGVIIRGGQTIEVVEGSASLLLVRCALVRQAYKDQGAPILVDYLEQVKDDDDTAKP